MADEKEQDDKTEDPSDRRIEQAIERGDVPKSMEAATFFALSAGTLALIVTGTAGLGDFVSGMKAFLQNAHQLSFDRQGLIGVATYSTWKFFVIMAIPFIFAVAAGITQGMIMHRPLWTTEPLMPKLNRISPKSGFKRIFGKEAFVQFAKSLAKFAIVTTVIILVLWPERARLDVLVRLDPGMMMDASWTLTLKLLGGVLAVFAFVAVADILYQRFSWRQRQRMTREEVKQEYKETEGSPEMKARIRKVRMEVLQRRMMSAVPKATLVLTNPTHYAVALRYEAGMNAPVVLAKGVDSLALRIRALATEHEIPVVENPPLARALHARVEIDDEIPEEHYKAVAEVIGYVMRLRRQRF